MMHFVLLFGLWSSRFWKNVSPNEIVAENYKTSPVRLTVFSSAILPSPCKEAAADLPWIQLTNSNKIWYVIILCVMDMW